MAVYPLDDIFFVALSNRNRLMTMPMLTELETVLFH